MFISLPEFSDRRFIGQLSMTSFQSEKTSRGWTSDGKWINNATLRRFTWAHWARGTRTDGTCTEGPPRCWTMPFFERWWPPNWPHNPWVFIPIGSMYAIYGNIYHKYPPNVSIYTIHGSYGHGFSLIFPGSKPPFISHWSVVSIFFHDFSHWKNTIFHHFPIHVADFTTRGLGTKTKGETHGNYDLQSWWVSSIYLCFTWRIFYPLTEIHHFNGSPFAMTDPNSAACCYGAPWM